jgi:quercetin dioxygenase-like cupin family protein
MLNFGGLYRPLWHTDDSGVAETAIRHPRARDGMDEYTVVSTEDVERVDLTDVEEYPLSVDVRAIASALGSAELRVNVWHLDPGEEVPFHVHTEQEELFYVREGEFRVWVGDPDDAETFTADAGAFWVVGPDWGRGHRCVGNEEGTLLAFGTPAVDDYSPEWIPLEEVEG